MNEHQMIKSSNNTVADPVAGEGGARNMKSIRPPSVAIFFMTYLYRRGGSHGLLGPPDPLLQYQFVLEYIKKVLHPINSNLFFSQYHSNIIGGALCRMYQLIEGEYQLTANMYLATNMITTSTRLKPFFSHSEDDSPKHFGYNENPLVKSNSLSIVFASLYFEHHHSTKITF